MKKIKEIAKYILVPLIVGFIGYLLGGKPEIYTSIAKPSFAPPSFLFPIAWSIIYILLGIGAYLVSQDKSSKKALTIYYIGLGINALWSLIFFRLHLFLLSSIWIILLLIVVCYMFTLFLRINKTAGYLQVPYILWLIFAFILNYSIYILNV